MSAGKAWTPEEESLLRAKYPETPTRELSDTLGRNSASIECKARRMKLRRVPTVREADPKPDSYANPFKLMPRDDAQKLDKIDLLRINWSLYEMYRRELNNPTLSKAERHKLMNALSNHTSIINSVMKGTEDKLGEEDDLRAQLIRLEYKEDDQATPRRIRYRRKTYTLVE